ncbi:MAG: hypothetical protein ABIR79_12055 [Candidatus Binatia bacterium]
MRKNAIFALVVALGVLMVGQVGAASDPALKCRHAVVKGAAKLAHVRLTALRKCEEAKRSGKVPALGACRDEADVAAALASATGKLATAIDRVCGGPDRRCGSGDDLGLAAMQWPSTCPELEGQGCGASLASCADVATCVACLADAAVTRGVALVYAPFAVADPKTQKAIARCQKTLASAATVLADTRLKVDARCLAARLDGKHDQPCPLPGDGKAAAVLAKARAKAEASVCKACGGADKRCGGGDDLTRELVGVAAACPGVGLCATAIASFTDLVACFDCTAAVRGDCALAGAAPGVVDYPAVCAAVPSTPTPTVTPTPTETPIATPTLSTTPTAMPTPIFCAAAGAGSVTSDVTLTLATGGALVGGASVTLDYDPARVRLPAAGDAAPLRARVTDLTAGALVGKGAPNNRDDDGDLEPDQVRFTLVAQNGVLGAILKVTFDRCSGAALTSANDYACTIDGKAVAPDGVTSVPGVTCTLALVHAP